MLKTISPYNTSILALLADCRKEYKTSDLPRLLPDAPRDVIDIAKVILEGRKALNGGPKKYKDSIEAVANEIKDWSKANEPLEMRYAHARK